jgi:hypothetical protein
MISEEDIEKADYLKDEIRDEKAIAFLEAKNKLHAGTLVKEEYRLWIVQSELGDLQLHPDDVEVLLEYERKFDGSESRISFSPQVQFKIVEHEKLTGTIKYAKLKWL